MKKLITIAALITAAFSASAAHAEAVFDYSYAFSNGVTVNGSFTGTANGNLITNLSNISAFLNGTAFNGSGSLYASSLVRNGWGYQWQSGGAVVSFDGLQSNFLFMDADYPNNTSYTNYFHDVGTPDRQLFATSKGVYGQNAYDYDLRKNIDGVWSVKAAYVAPELPANVVPEPTSVLLMGMGLVGLVAARRKKQA